MQASFDPVKVVVVLGGVPILGFTRGTAVEIAYTSPLWTEKTDLSGKLVRSKTNDLSAIVTLTLDQSSPSNAYLSRLAQRDLLAGSGSGVFSITDLNGATFYTSAQAYVKAYPNSAWGAESDARAWQIVCSRLVGFESGLPLDDLAI